MGVDTKSLVAELTRLASRNGDRFTLLEAVADRLRSACGYRWVGLYDVDPKAGIVANVVWSGPSAPAHPTFSITSGLMAVVIAARKTLNVGDVWSDPRYLTALGTTRSEIIVPVFDKAGQRVIGTIDVESEDAHAFGDDAQALLEACSVAMRPLWLR